MTMQTENELSTSRGEQEPAVHDQLQTLANQRGLQLAYCDGALTLTDGTQSLAGDFAHLVPRIRGDKAHSELIVKAAKIKGAEGPLRLLDATAGLGEDSLLLAAAGFQVDLYERNPIVGALLADALARAGADPALSLIVSRMTLHQEDSLVALREIAESDPRPDVVLLDPMFPARRKSASVKKKLQMIQKLEDPCDQEEDLLQAALNAHPRKIVVKRPPKGPFLNDRKPSYSLNGKAVRFDVYVLPPR